MGCCGLGLMLKKCLAASPKVGCAVVKVGELHRFAVYGSVTRLEYPGTLGCCTQPNTAVRMTSSAIALMRTCPSVGCVSTVPEKFRSVLTVWVRLFLLFL